MNTVAIRERLTSYIQIADDKKLKAVYTLLEDDIKDGESISLARYNNEINEAIVEKKRKCLAIKK